MAHLNLYLPDEVADALKREANSARVPLSRFVLSRLQGGESTKAWPPGYFTQTCGFLIEDLKEPTDAPPEPIDLDGLE